MRIPASSARAGRAYSRAATAAMTSPAKPTFEALSADAAPMKLVVGAGGVVVAPVPDGATVVRTTLLLDDMRVEDCRLVVLRAAVDDDE